MGWRIRRETSWRSASDRGPWLALMVVFSFGWELRIFASRAGMLAIDLASVQQQPEDVKFRFLVVSVA